MVSPSLKECTHPLALLWGTRHLISPELAEKDVVVLLLPLPPAQQCACRDSTPTLRPSNWRARRPFSASMWLRSAVSFFTLSLPVATSISCAAKFHIKHKRDAAQGHPDC